jgi:O-antigen ligase
VRYLTYLSLALALVCIQILIGGVKLVFSLPACVLLALGALIAFSGSRKVIAPPKACAFSALALAGWVTGRALFSPVEYLARSDFFLILAVVLIYFLTVMYFTAARARIVVVGLLLLVALVHVCIGGVQFKQGDNFMLLPGIMRSDYTWRASGFYVCPNHLAGLLEMMTLLALGQACWGNLRWGTRVIAGYCALMCLAGVAITGSRGGYLAIVFGFVVFAALSLWKVQLARRSSFWLIFSGLLLGVGILLGGGLLLMAQSDTLHARLGQIYDPTNPRLLLWKAALMQYHLEPITGTGSGTYLFYGRQFRFPIVQNDPMHVHNDYLELLAEYGLVGAILCGTFIVIHLVSGMAGLRRIVREQIAAAAPDAPVSSPDVALVIGAFSAIAALLLHSVVDFNMHIPANAWVVAFLFGILASPQTPSSASDTNATHTPGWWRWLGLAVAIVLLGFSVKLLPGEIFAEKARVALRDDRNGDALEAAKRGLRWEKKNPFLYGHKAEAEHFLTLTAPDPETARMWDGDAANDYEIALKLFPQDTGLLLKRAQILDLLGRFPEAEDIFQRLFQIDPLFGNVYSYYGLHWQLQRRMQAAELCFRIANRLGETDISSKGLQNIEKLKADPMGQAFISHLSGPQLNLPAEWILREQ